MNIKILLAAAFFLLAGSVSSGFAMDKEVNGWNVETKVTLLNFFTDCNRYWLNEGFRQSCEVKIVSAAEYGFKPSPGVVITILNGTYDDFSATASHPKATKTYTIDSKGEVQGKTK